MISRQNIIDSPEHCVTAFSYDAKEAITRGAKRGDPVAELELLGLPVRTINLLEDSRLQITLLSELMSYRQEELLEIQNFGAHGLRELMQCLAQYHHLEEARRRLSSAFDQRKVSAMRELLGSGATN